MTASLPCMQWLAEPGPRRPPVAPLTSTSVTHGCHVIRWPGLVRNSQATCGGTSVGTDTIEDRLLRASTKTRPRASSSCQRRSRSSDPDRHLADPVVGLGVLAHAERGRVEAGGVDARLAEQRVGVDAQLLDDLVLEQPVDDDHVRPEQLLPAGDLLLDRDAVVDDELEVEVGDPRRRRCTRRTSPGGRRAGAGGTRSSSARSCRGASTRRSSRRS